MSKRSRPRGKSSSQHKRAGGHAQANDASRENAALRKQADWQLFRANILPFIILAVVTFIAYANAWPDNLTRDDVEFAVSERFSGLGPAELARFFTEDAWAAFGHSSGLYRPFLLLSIAIDAAVFGDWVAGYHLINILLHVLATAMLYGFIRHLLLVSGGESSESSLIALLAALIFGVYPLHTEVVNAIFNRSGILGFIGVVGGLWWFLKTWKSQPQKAWWGLAAIYLLVLLCKEDSATLPALAVVLLWITSPGNWSARFRSCLPVFWLLIPLLIYGSMRANALSSPEMIEGTGPQVTEQIVGSNQIDDRDVDHESWLNYDLERIPQAVRFMFDSMKIKLSPHALRFHHGQPATGLWIALALQLALIGLAVAGYLYYKRIGLLAGVVFFYITLLPSSRILFAEDTIGIPELAERYLYLPSVGLVIVLAFGLGLLMQRFDERSVTVFVLIVTIMLTPLTWARNADWASDILLDEAEYRTGNRAVHVIKALVLDHSMVGNHSRSVEICDRHFDALKEDWILSDGCGTAYSHVGRIDAAEQVFSLALDIEGAPSAVHDSMGDMYLRLGRRRDAENYYLLSIDEEERPFLKEYKKANMLIQLNQSDRASLREARAHLEQVLVLQPQFFRARTTLNKLNAILGY